MQTNCKKKNPKKKLLKITKLLKWSFWFWKKKIKKIQQKSKHNEF